MNELANLSLAKRQVAALKGFYIHLAAFVLVMGLLFGIDASTGSGWWVQWPLLGWGVGVLGHAFAVFGQLPSVFARWERNKIDELKRRLDDADRVTAEAQKSPKPAPADSQGNDRIAS